MTDGGGTDMTDQLLTAGTRAPDFELSGSVEGPVRLSSMAGAPVILAFYPADFSPVCGDQMALYEVVRPEFDRYGARILGLSVDGVWCHRAFAADRGVHFPLLSDFEPKGEVARAYGAYDKKEGMAERALFVIDGEGIVAWSYVSPSGMNPGADGILNALEALAAEGKASS
jgi:peroxiredoxin